jgi:carnitine-CoA ligase
MATTSAYPKRPPHNHGASESVIGTHQEVCLVRTLHARQEARRDEVFFSCDGDTLTYGQLWNDAGALAAALRSAGVVPGTIVAALAYNSTDLLCLMFACLRLGAVWAPLNVALGPEDLQHSLQTTQAKLLVVSAEMAERNLAPLTELAKTVPILQLDAATTPALPFMRLLTREPDAAQHPAHSWEAEAFCWIIFSGATTGRPKAIALPHSYGIASAQRSVEALELGPQDACYSVLQMCHGWLLFHIIVMSLVAGIPCATTRWFSASRWLAEVRRHRATIVDPLLPMISAIMAQPERPDDGDNPARVCYGALGSVSEDAGPRLVAFERRFKLKTLNCYGSTEIGGLVARETLHASRFGTSGQPHPYFEFRIADERGWPLPQGVAGEILVRPLVPGIIALGYLGNSDGTLHAWRDLWVHTSDIGLLDADGFLNFAGRHAHWIRRRSENVSIKEVEEALKAVDGVIDAGVIGIRAELGDEDAAAFLVLSDEVTLEYVRDRLAERLAYFKVPRFYERVAILPKTVKGEVSRRELKERGLTAAAWDAGAASSKMQGATGGSRPRGRRGKAVEAHSSR